MSLAKTASILLFLSSFASASRVVEIQTKTAQNAMGFLGHIDVEIINPDGMTCNAFDLIHDGEFQH